MIDGYWMEMHGGLLMVEVDSGWMDGGWWMVDGG